MESSAPMEGTSRASSSLVRSPLLAATSVCVCVCVCVTDSHSHTPVPEQLYSFESKSISRSNRHMEEPSVTGHGVFDREFGFDSDEWSCS